MIALTIAKRELFAVLTSPVGWVVLSGYLMMSGLFWMGQVGTFQMMHETAIHNPYGGSGPTFANDLLLPFFGNCTVLIIMVTPALSMRLFSPEYKQHTLELLMTSPVSTTEMVVGKYLGALAFLVLLLLTNLYLPLSIQLYGGSVDYGLVLGGVGALFGLGAAVIAMGMWISSLTDNQLAAVLTTFSIAMILYILSFWNSDPESLLFKVSLSGHVVDLIRGAVRTVDIVYFVGFCSLFLFFTQQKMESLRWR